MKFLPLNWLVSVIFLHTVVVAGPNVPDLQNNSKNFVRLFNGIHKKDPQGFFQDFKDLAQRYRSNPGKFKELMTEQDGQGWSIFFHAVEIGDMHRLAFMLDQLQRFFRNDLDSYLQIVNLQDVHGRTPLFIAAERREIAIVNLLLNKVKYALKGNKELFSSF